MPKALSRHRENPNILTYAKIMFTCKCRAGSPSGAPFFTFEQKFTAFRSFFASFKYSEIPWISRLLRNSPPNQIPKIFSNTHSEW